MSIELEQRLHHLELRLNELQRRVETPPRPDKETTAIAKDPAANPRRRDATGRFAR